MATGLSTYLSLGFKMFFSPEFNQGVEKMVNMKHWCSVSAMRAQLAICKCALCYCYMMIWQSKGFLHGAHVKSPPCFLYLVLLWEHQFWCTMTHCQWVTLCACLDHKVAQSRWPLQASHRLGVHYRLHMWCILLPWHRPPDTTRPHKGLLARETYWGYNIHLPVGICQHLI